MSRSSLVVGACVLAAFASAPLYGSDFFVEFVMTRVLIVGIAAATIAWLTENGGLTSMAQLLMSGIAGFMYANASLVDGQRGLSLGWNVWISVLFALVIATGMAFLFGVVASRTTGIYFLMLTFIYSVIGFFFFGQVTTFSGFGGITGVDPPVFLIDAPLRLFYLSLVMAALAFVSLKALERTPFGLVLRGIRDDPVRMAALGYNVPLHRALAFTVAGFVAAVSGLLNVWWNGFIDPTGISVGPTIDLLVVAVVGGIARTEGAWLGAFVFVAGSVYLRSIGFLNDIGLTEDRFNTVIGVVVLLIVVLSPDGIVGLFERLKSARLKGGPAAVAADTAS